MKETNKTVIMHGACDYFLYRFENFLKKVYPDSKILFYVDNDVNKQRKKTHTGYDVYSVDKIKEYPDALILIITDALGAVAKQYEELGIKNTAYSFPIFLHHGFDDGWNPAEASKIILENKDRIKNAYDNDEKTQAVIDMYIKTSLDYERFYTLDEFGNTLDMLGMYFANLDYTPKNEGFTFIDGGAYDGDTLRHIYARFGNKLKKYYAFEPDLNNLEKLRKTVKDLGLEDVVDVMPYALGEKEEEIKFKSTGTMASHVAEDGDIVTKIVGIDDLNLEIIGDVLVRMDIKGFELATLKGAKNLIQKHKPYLDIVVHEKPEDLFILPEYIREIYPNPKIRIGCAYHTEMYVEAK